MKYENIDLVTLESVCIEATPEAGNASLLHDLHNLLPDLTFDPVLMRSGWYRIGGVVDANGKRITDKLTAWVEEEAAGDALSLYNKYAHESFIATRLNGKTHYLVAQTGSRPQDFIQLEVEEVHEVLDRPLFEEDALPELVEEIIDPLEYVKIESKVISPSRYLFRRIIPIADYLDKLIDKEEIHKPPVIRFIADWEKSSAGESTVFSKHWVLNFREYTDGYGEPKFHAKPITTYVGEIPFIGGEDLPRGAELANLIHDFDRKIGYPMAWYFFMLSHKQISHQIADSIHKDLMGAYAYLPAKDVKVLQNWYDNSYGA